MLEMNHHIRNALQAIVGVTFNASDKSAVEKLEEERKDRVGTSRNPAGCPTVKRTRRNGPVSEQIGTVNYQMVMR